MYNEPTQVKIVSYRRYSSIVKSVCITLPCIHFPYIHLSLAWYVYKAVAGNILSHGLTQPPKDYVWEPVGQFPGELNLEKTSEVWIHPDG